MNNEKKKRQKPKGRRRAYAVMDVNTGAALLASQQFVADNMMHGAICPTCGRLVKIYPRTITAMMAYALILIERRLRHSHEFLHVTTFLLEFRMLPNVASAIRGDWPKLRHWGLLEMADGARADGSDRVGDYRITDLGRAFVRGEVAFPKHLFIYNNKVLDVTTFKPVKEIRIRDTFGKRFNYEELMGALPDIDAFDGIVIHNPLVDVEVDTERGTLFAA